jgi:AAA family ATP:ADP antiporter
MPPRVSDCLRLERREAFVAASVLLLTVAGHALRETARDALFLAGLPAARLPEAYLAIAALTVVIACLGGKLDGRVGHRTLLSGILGVGCLVDVGFWWAVRCPHPGTLLALYVWTGVLATALTIEFWLALADACEGPCAARVFTIAGSGALAGALIGSAAARALLAMLSVRSLLLGAAGLQGLAAPLPWLLRDRVRGARRHRHAPPGWEPLFRTAYLRRLLALAGLMAVLGTTLDFAFKAVVSVEIPRASLGRFLAEFGLAANVAALFVQTLVAPALLEGLGVFRALAVLPTLALLGSGAVLVVSGFFPLLAVEGADRALRHSLHRTGVELLHLPLEPAQRHAAQTLVESLGARGGQALAALGILLAVSMHAGERALGGALALLATLTLASLAGLQRTAMGQRMRGRGRTVLAQGAGR